MDAFLESLQQSAFARFVGESGSLLGYPTVLFLHTQGLGTVAGVSARVSSVVQRRREVRIPTAMMRPARRGSIAGCASSSASQ